MTFSRGLAFSFALTLSSTAIAQPNVILIMTDDQGVGDYGFQGVLLKPFGINEIVSAIQDVLEIAPS